MTGRDFLDAVEAARESEVFRHYLEVRERVVEMLEEAHHADDFPSAYWGEELAGFDYILDASPLIIRNLREHCHHLTGVRAYEYRKHHSHQRDAFARKLAALREQDGDNLFVPESPLLGGFGHVIDGALCNLDTLKYYESLIALNRSGMLARFRQPSGERKVVMEIGAGWGGFAYQFKRLCPGVVYIIVDLPQTLIFSAVYLRALFPDARVLLYGDKRRESLLEGCERYDFVFLPNFFVQWMELARVDLVVNIASFQEMRWDQVDRYVQNAYELRCPVIYSLNRERSPHNEELDSLRAAIGRYYTLSEVRVLDVPYGVVPVRIPAWRGYRAIAGLARRVRRWRGDGAYEYHHLVGVRRDVPGHASS